MIYIIKYVFVCCMIHSYIAKVNALLANFRRRKCFKYIFLYVTERKKKNDKGNKYKYSMKAPQ